MKNFPKNRIVILGSGGFISNALEKILIKKKDKYLALNRKKLDLENPKRAKILKTTIKKNDIILFIAAKAPVKSLKMFKRNINILKNFCENSNTELIKKIIYISSDAVYADTKNKINERSLIMPTSLHGYMHSIREFYLNKIFKNKLCVLRPTLIYGDSDPHNSYGPNSFVRNLLKKENINLYGKGEEKRDHIWVNDLAEIIYKCAHNRFIGILNVASGKTYSFYKIAKIIKSLEKNQTKIIFRKRNGPMHHLGLRQFNVSLLKKTISPFNPQKFENVIRVIYKNYKKQ
jgi:nucleoside-diphosphate-sugar epimerase